MWPVVILYLAVVSAPLALAWAQGLPPRSAWDELATAAGLLAASVLLVEFPLSGRLRMVTRKLGMDVTMRLHQGLARIALGLALIHPFLYAGARNPAHPWDVTRQLTLAWTPEALWPGILAWLLLPALVGAALVRSGQRYETWRLVHGLGAALIVALVIWHALVAGRYSADPALAGLWLAFGAVAALMLARVYLLVPLAQLRRPWRVTACDRVADRTWSLTIAPEGHAGLRFQAGQFVWLNVGASPFTLRENPFSIASAPADGPELRFVIKELGDFTRSLGTVAPGTRACLDGPFGHLTLVGRDASGVVLIAGGVGIAPLLGILEQMRATGDARPVTLIYANRAEDQIVDRARLEAMREAGALDLVLVLSEPPEGWTGEIGMIDADLLGRV
ncbi:MAG: hypothetical protein EP307_06790, partial [Rhodobacteraceae bacterium]